MIYMTGKRFTLNSVLNFDFGICDYGEPIGSLRNICELLNELSEENEQCKMMIATLLEENQSIKKHIGELYKYVKIDVDNEIEVYPKVLLEGIVDILKIIGDVE